MDTAVLDAAVSCVRARLGGVEPEAAIILGSGWGAVRELFDARGEICFEEIPGLGATGVPGHAGRLVWGELSGVMTLIFQGRRHFYEGAGWTPIAIPIAIAHATGAGLLLLTNASGGLNPGFVPGDLMVIRDHINFMGSNPLLGPPLERFGPRFPDLSSLYDRTLAESLLAAGVRAGVPLRQGTFLAVTGPTYETPAESRAFASLGADAVGMSTVPEAILAHAAGMRVAALSCIANMAAGFGAGVLSHTEVTAMLASSMPRLRAVVGEFFKALSP